jgi:hypothetical protein
MIPAFLIGVACSPLVVKVAKSLVRGTVKTTVEVGLQAKNLATQTADGFRNLTIEASLDEARNKS